jgi:hypothetical protein
MRVRIASSVLLSYITQDSEHRFRVFKGIPKGCKFVRITSNEIYGLDLIIEHESFRILQDGDIIPIYNDSTSIVLEGL